MTLCAWKIKLTRYCVVYYYRRCSLQEIYCILSSSMRLIMRLFLHLSYSLHKVYLNVGQYIYVYILTSPSKNYICFLKATFSIILLLLIKKEKD